MNTDYTGNEKKMKFSIRNAGKKVFGTIRRKFEALTVPGLLKVTLLLVILHLVIFLFRPLPVLVRNVPAGAGKLLASKTRTTGTYPRRRTRTTAPRRRRTTTSTRPAARQRQAQIVRNPNQYRKPVTQAPKPATEAPKAQTAE